MRQPKLGSLVLDSRQTKRVRQGMSVKKIKITINVDADSLSTLKSRASKTGVPYQRMINHILKQALEREEDAQSRLERLEKEVARLKKRVAA
jgi:uncharacterized protein (DUF4415 family)